MFDADSPLLTTPDTAQLYRDALEMLNRTGVPYLVGGTYAAPQAIIGLEKPWNDKRAFRVSSVTGASATCSSVTR